MLNLVLTLCFDGTLKVSSLFRSNYIGTTTRCNPCHHGAGEKHQQLSPEVRRQDPRRQQLLQECPGQEERPSSVQNRVEETDRGAEGDERLREEQRWEEWEGKQQQHRGHQLQSEKVWG